jgi:hypothetical protein
MKSVIIVAGVIALAASHSPVFAQVADESDEGDYVADGNFRNAAQNSNRPSIGIRRKADFIIFPVSFTSDSRDAAVRKQEIHAMLNSALERANGGIELTSGSPVLKRVTTANYQSLQMTWAGREDTSKVELFVKVPLATTADEAKKRVSAFIKAIPLKGRGTIDMGLVRQLAIRNPDQYRGAIIALVAEEVRRNAAVFGPDYRGSIDGLDKQVLWAQSSDIEVFLYLPYSYRIVSK